MICHCNVYPILCSLFCVTYKTFVLNCKLIHFLMKSTLIFHCNIFQKFSNAPYMIHWFQVTHEYLFQIFCRCDYIYILCHETNKWNENNILSLIVRLHWSFSLNIHNKSNIACHKSCIYSSTLERLCCLSLFFCESWKLRKLEM